MTFRSRRFKCSKYLNLEKYLKYQGFKDTDHSLTSMQKYFSFSKLSRNKVS